MTFLHIARAYTDIHSTAHIAANFGQVENAHNTNLNTAQKRLLQWYYKLGHLDFQWVQWLGVNNWLSCKAFTTANIPAIKCASCLYGKQSRTKQHGKHFKLDPPGALRTHAIKPGDRVFMDSYESRLPGQAFNIRGSASLLKYTGGTLFCNAASSYIYVVHQIGQTAAEAIDSKLEYERESMTCGVRIKTYHTDNGVFDSQEILAEISAKGQGIRFCSVRAHHQNGVAENAI